MKTYWLIQCVCFYLFHIMIYLDILAKYRQAIITSEVWRIKLIGSSYCMNLLKCSCLCEKLIQTMHYLLSTKI